MKVETTPNPYEPPVPAPVDAPETFLPLYLSARTARIVNWFGLFEVMAWIGVSFWTDRLFLDVFALFIATNGARIRRTSCRKFPWTILMCAVYPLMFIFSITQWDALDPANWLPTPNSPVLGLQLIVAIWSTFAAGALWQCYLYQNSPQSFRP